MNDIISIYTREQAIRDGMLFRLGQYFANQEFPSFFADALKQLQDKPKKFPLGNLIITANAASRLNPVDVLIGLIRHHAGDRGDLCDEDRAENQRSLADDGRLFSVYDFAERFYVITEWNREATTVLLPEDY